MEWVGEGCTGRIWLVVGLAASVGLGVLGCGGQDAGPKSLSMERGSAGGWRGDYVGCSELGALGGDIAAINGLGLAVRLAPLEASSDGSARCLLVAVLQPHWLSHQVGYCASKVEGLLPDPNVWPASTEGPDDPPNWAGVLLAKGAVALEETLDFSYDTRGYRVIFEQLHTRPENGAPGSARLTVTGDASSELKAPGDTTAAAHEQTSVLVGLESIESAQRQYGYWPGDS